jgi:WD40 repeat protein
MLKHRLLIAEYIFLFAAVVGWVVAILLGHLIYAAVPVSVALLLNLLNRLRLEQQMKRRLTAAMNQLERQLIQENYALHEQRLEAAIAQEAPAKLFASLKAQIPEYLAQLESSELQSSALKIIQFNERLTSLEESLNSVVEYLNSTSLPSRVERLEDAIASATDEITWIEHQLADTRHNRSNEHEEQLPTIQPPEFPTVTEPQLFTSELTNSVPIEPHPLSPSSAFVPVEEPQDFSLPSQNWSVLQLLKEHSDWVSALAISPDGQTLVSGSFDKTINVWHLPTGELIHTLSQHSKGVLCLAISPDGQTLASGSFDETIKLWRLDTGELINTLNGHTSSVRSLAISEDGQTLISGSLDETIKLWRLDTGEFLGNLCQWTGQVSAITLSPDGQTLASGGGDGVISLRLLDTAEGQIKPSPAIALTGNVSSVCSLAMTPDGEILAAGCTDGNVKLWDIGTLKPLGVLQGHAGPVMSLVFSSDTPTLISGSADGTIIIWHLGTGQQLGILTDNSAASVMAIAISPDGRLIASGGADSTIKLWQRD